VAHVFVADLADPQLDDADRHHLERVLRLRAGEEVTVSDGRGGWRRCTFGAGGDLQPEGEVEQRPQPAPAITVAFALTKGDKPELTVQKLTELGVDRIVPFVAARSVVRWDDERAARQVERLRRVAREAGMQSRRAHLPEVAEVADFATVARLPGAVLADAGGQPPALATPAVLVGPEGGWSDEERAAGLPCAGLGDHVLRAETAAITAAALWTALRAGRVQHAELLHSPDLST
jgi:16S rRNA (uracil1498-N3)-methyltransferase